MDLARWPPSAGAGSRVSARSSRSPPRGSRRPSRTPARASSPGSISSPPGSRTIVCTWHSSEPCWREPGPRVGLHCTRSTPGLSLTRARSRASANEKHHGSPAAPRTALDRSSAGFASAIDTEEKPQRVTGGGNRGEGVVTVCYLRGRRNPGPGVLVLDKDPIGEDRDHRDELSGTKRTGPSSRGSLIK